MNAWCGEVQFADYLFANKAIRCRLNHEFAELVRKERIFPQRISPD